MSEVRDELPDGWEWTPFSRIIDSLKNGLYKPVDVYGSGTPCLRMYNIADGRIVWKDIHLMRLSEKEVDEYGLIPGDVLINRVNSRELVGKAAVIPDGLGTIVFESKNIRMRLKRNLAMPQYVNYFLLTRQSRAQIEPEAKQTVGMATVNQADVNAWRIPLPPLDDQHRIVAKIEQLFAESRTVREALDGVPTLIKRFRQSVLAKAFRGELTERDPNDEPASVLLERIRVERQAKSKKGVEPEPPDIGSLPELPEGWCWASYAMLTSFITSGSRGWAEHYSDSGPFFIRVGNLSYRSIEVDFSDAVHVMPPDGMEKLRTRVQANDILIAVTGNTFGMVAVVPESISEAYINQHIALTRPMEYLDVKYVAYYLASQEGGQKQFADAQYGMTKPGLSLAQMKNIKVPLAPLAEQRRIVARIEALFAQADAIEDAVNIARRQAEKVDQAILARAFRGEL